MSDAADVRWWWVRHAPVVDHGGRIYGQLDMACDTSDAAAFSALAEVLPQDALWVTSHLGRTRATAAALFAAGCPACEPAVEPEIAEQHFGRWQGKSWDEIAAEDPATSESFWRDPAVNAPPGGESFAALVQRTKRAVERLTGANAGRDIVAVAHGGTIRAAVAIALSLAPVQAMAVRIDNLSLTRIDRVAGGLLRGRGGAWRVVGVNVPPR